MKKELYTDGLFRVFANDFRGAKMRLGEKSGRPADHVRCWKVAKPKGESIRGQSQVTKVRNAKTGETA